MVAQMCRALAVRLANKTHLGSKSKSKLCSVQVRCDGSLTVPAVRVKKPNKSKILATKK